MNKIGGVAVLTKLQKKFFAAINGFISCEENGPCKAMKKAMDCFTYKKEFATLKLVLPRRMGNTTILLELFKKYKESVLIPYTKDYLKEDRIRSLPKERVFLAGPCLRGMKTGIVFIDVGSYVTEKKLKNIYDIEAKFYIFLG